MITIALALLESGGAGFLFRLLRGPGVPDRVGALDVQLSVVVSGIIVAADTANSGIMLSTVLVVSLVGFVGTAALARFVERRGG